MNEILKAWEKLKSVTMRAFTGKVARDLPAPDAEHIKEQIAECVYSTGGEISSRTRAVELGKIYLELSTNGKYNFMRLLAHEYGVDHKKIDACIESYQTASNEEKRIEAEMALMHELIPPRVKLLKMFNALPNGFKFLIDFRAELMPIRKSDPKLKKLEEDLRRILSSWFDIGLLDLEEITWHSPASMLEKLIQYEAVHEIRSWADLKNRLDSDRLCYAFFHNKIPDEPLIFVEIAMLNRLADNIGTLLDQSALTINPQEADTAIFYSISNAQKGLAGINLGNFLIKRVVSELANTFKNLKHFATLSPVPRFRKWLKEALASEEESLLTEQEKEKLKRISTSHNTSIGLLALLNSDWSGDPEKVQELKPILMRLCAYYLTEIKRKKKAYDPVANFHLSNGARLEQINWLADISKKGLIQSAGIMVNYYYKLPEIEKNHELYVTESKINISKDIKKWLN
jgi:malonyl-CoA decarboxylase